MVVVMLLMGRSCTATWWVPGMVAVTPLGWAVVNSTWLLFCLEKHWPSGVGA